MFLSLEQAYNLALERDLNYRLSFIKSEIAHLRYRVALIKRYAPVPSLGFTWNRDVMMLGADTRSYSLEGSFSLPLWDWGVGSLEVLQLRVAYLLSIDDLRRARSRLKLDVFNRLSQVVLLERKLDILRELKNLLEMQLKFEKERFKVGSSTELDVLEIESELAAANVRILKTQNELSTALDRLKIYLGIEENITVSDAFLANDPSMLKLPELSLEKVISMVMGERKDAIQAFVLLRKARKSYFLTRHPYLPVLSFNGKLSLSGDSFPPRERSFSLGMSVSFGMPYQRIPARTGLTFSGGSRGLSESLSFTGDPEYAIRLLRARAELIQRIREVEDLEKEIRLEATSAYNRMVESFRELRTYIEKEKVFKKRYEIYREKEKIGEATKLDFLKAQREYFEARIQVQQALVNYLVQVRTLELMLSERTGWLDIVNEGVNSKDHGE